MNIYILYKLIHSKGFLPACNRSTQRLKRKDLELDTRLRHFDF